MVTDKLHHDDISPTDAPVRTVLMEVPVDVALNGMVANNIL